MNTQSSLPKYSRTGQNAKAPRKSVTVNDTSCTASNISWALKHYTFTWLIAQEDFICQFSPFCKRYTMPNLRVPQGDTYIFTNCTLQCGINKAF